MCLIIYKPKGKKFLCDEDIKKAISANSDGIGVMYPVEHKGIKRLAVEKLLGTEKELFEFFLKMKHIIGDKQAVLHVRYKTAGAIDKQNAHPFQVLNMDRGDKADIAMVHNGTIGVVAKEYLKKKNFTDTCSDTSKLVKGWLSPMLRRDPTLLGCQAFKEMVESFVTDTNKLCFMNTEGEVYLYNKHKWHEREGCMLSNKYTLIDNGRYKTDAGVSQWEKMEASRVKKLGTTTTTHTGAVTTSHKRGCKAAQSCLYKGVSPPPYKSEEAIESSYYDTLSATQQLTEEFLGESTREDIQEWVRTEPDQAADFLDYTYGGYIGM